MESATIQNSSDSSTSHFFKTVVLKEWWLVKSQTEYEEKSLCVSGVPDELVVRVFISAQVMKRHSVTMLETSDGVYVILRGFINRLRTEESGFSSKVFKYFLFGFPLNWEEYAGAKLADDECLCPVPSPRKTTALSYAITNDAERSTENSLTGEAIDVAKAMSRAKKSKSYNKSAKSDVGASSGVREVEDKLKTSDNNHARNAIDVIKAMPKVKKCRSDSYSSKANVGASSGFKELKEKLRTYEISHDGEAIGGVKDMPTEKKSKNILNLQNLTLVLPLV